MLSQRTILVLSLSGSLLLHAGVIGTGVYYIGQSIIGRDLSVPAEASKPDALPEPRPEISLLQIGRADGVGTANESMQGDLPQTAQEAWSEQAFLSREPQGEMGRQPKPPMPPVLTTPPEEPLYGVAEQPVDLTKIASAANVRTQPVPAAQTPPPQPQQPAEANQKAPGTPAPQSDRDSDLFSETVAIDLTAGKVSARSGREVKFARPRVNLAAIVDMATISFPAILKVRIDIDETGKVRRVVIVQSTGSTSLDRAYELAIYESWFEPKVANGKPVRDQQVFAFRIH